MPRQKVSAPEKVDEKVFKFGGFNLSILNQKDELIPKKADKIHLHQEHSEALALSIMHDLPTLLIGETGTGKTSVVRYLAFMRAQGYTRINMHGYNTPDELIGSKSVKNGATYYENGILTNAMIRGHIVVLDEINATPPDCTFIIHGLLDDDKRVALPNGDIIRPHKDFRFYATMNPDYEGTRTLNRAFMDRFVIVLNVDILPPEEESELLVTRANIKKEVADKMVSVAWMGRKAYRENKTMMMISTRTLLQWATLTQQGINQDRAYQISVVNKAHKDEKDAFTDFYKIVFNSKPGSTDDKKILQFITKGEIMDWEKNLNEAKSLLKDQETRRQILEKELSEARSGVDKQAFDQMKSKVKDYEDLFIEMKKKINF